MLLVCSPGGHLQQLLALRPAWEDCDVTWVTLAGADVGQLLADQDVVLGHGPTNRSIRRLIQNLWFAQRTIRRRRPDAILSTGAALAVAFFIVGRLRHIQLVYVESLTRTEALSLSGKMVEWLADEFFVQWPGVAEGHGRYVGNVLGGGVLGKGKGSRDDGPRVPATLDGNGAAGVVITQADTSALLAGGDRAIALDGDRPVIPAAGAPQSGIPR